MSSSNDSLVLTWDPSWPWSVAGVGRPLLAVVALVLIVLTLWTYWGVRGASPRRVATLLALRLLALALIFLIQLRPALASRDELKVPSTLLIAADDSESMTIQDQFGNQSRWDYLRRLLRESAPQLQRLRDEHNVTIATYRFSSDVADFDPDGKAAGKRTDFGQMLQTLNERHGHERFLRGLLVLSDGADNGSRFPALTLAAKWRILPCPIHTFAFGLPTTTAQQRDVAFTAINPMPSPVAVKGKLTVKGTLDAPGFENASVRLRLFINDIEEGVAQDVKLTRTSGNEVQIACNAPATPGEIKVTLRVDPLRGELTTANNEISTYVTVTKDGISVLYVEGKHRAWEPKFIRYALSQDPRIRLFEAVLLQNQAVPAEDADLFQFDKQHYDVIILGDLSARRLTVGQPDALARISRLVSDRGTGLMMMGGYESFGNSDWSDTPISRLLPVELDATGQVSDPVQMVPTEEGLRHYVLRLSERENDNRTLWEKLRKLDGMTRLGHPKKGATVLATTADKAPLLVGQKYGEGRTLAFGGDTTWRWTATPEGGEAHARFWKQLVLWLARQDEAEGAVWVRPDVRRLAAGGKLGFSVGLRGKGGVEIKDARFEVKVVGPQEVETAVPTSRDQNDERGTFWKTDVPGEYRIVVRGRGKDYDGSEAGGEALARFLIYQDDVEMARQAADHEFLAKLANAGGGKAFRGEDLAQFLQDLRTTPFAQHKLKAKLWPDWRRSPTSPAARDQFAALAGSGILVCFLLFVILLSLEWFLRRYWGLV
jgi:uncharacterized membrane protein